MAEQQQFVLRLDRRTGYEFEAKFDWERVPPLLVDEPQPLGGSKGPNASRLVGAAAAASGCSRTIASSPPACGKGFPCRS